MWTHRRRLAVIAQAIWPPGGAGRRARRPPGRPAAGRPAASTPPRPAPRFRR